MMPKLNDYLVTCPYTFNYYKYFNYCVLYIFLDKACKDNNLPACYHQGVLMFSNSRNEETGKINKEVSHSYLRPYAFIPFLNHALHFVIICIYSYKENH